MRKLLACVALLLACALLSMMPTAYAANSDFYSNGIWTKLGRKALNYHHETKKTTTVYADADFTQPIGTVPVHTFVKPIFDPSISGPYVTNVNGLEALHCAYITYPDAKSGSGWVRTENVDSCYVAVGYTTYHYLEYINVYLPSKAADGDNQSSNAGSQGNTGSSSQSDSKPSSVTSSSNKNKTSSKSNSTKKTETVQVPAHDILWQGEKVTVRTLGVVNSGIVADSKEQTVSTAELQFSDNVPAEKRVAAILAPRTGRCYLRAKASSKGTVIDKCPAGTVVQVIKYGKSYCKIVFEGQVGYVQTACLTFLDPAAAILGTTVLTYNGRATGAAQVPIRNTASNDSCIVVKLRSGTEVTVLARTGKWYEVAYEGLHGFVHESFMDAEIK